jgi:hypothetical protein
MRQYTYVAMAGSDYIRDEHGRSMRKSIEGWDKWAEQEAKSKSRPGRKPWKPIVTWADHRACFQIMFTNRPLPQRRAA